MTNHIDTPYMDYIPEDQWPSVSKMLDGFGEQTLPPSSALAGTSLSLTSTDGKTIDYNFISPNQLTWATNSETMPKEGCATYKAIEARKNIFLIDFIIGEGKQTQNVTFVLNKDTGIATSGISSFLSKDSKTRSTTEFMSLHTPEGKNTPVHQRSTGLVGKRIFYRYSDVEAYEHIYLSPGTFTWHCIRGGEQGLADTERCMTFDVAEDLYLFFWTERVMTVEAVLLIDLREQRSIGRMVCWDSSLDELVILPFNSRLSLMNETRYPKDYNKH
ncbi:molybdenum cofactor biosynthesis F family protein [Acinetobacter sp. ME22]|uniref:MoaF C-terminal domain-containing protein n=1 Tax=Acinetobacter sp. ME22 TaxID=2904802 RepID=UPI001EDBC07F|nr:MoaF C-terminal domain-containing protein [Acinetobacter sp. ME22]MCG2575117.1 molybdenum cofactor biosynthesis F family protein [Acinetobacter sp. ME22]